MKTKLFILLAFIAVQMACTGGQSTEQEVTTNDSLTVDKEANWDGCMVSAYVFQEDGRHLAANAEQDIDTFETLINHKIGSIMWYPTFADPFPTKDCEMVKKRGGIPHLTWEIFFPDSVDYNTMPITGNYALMDQVLAGQHDAYITQFATDAKNFGDKVLIRFLHEFNGNWYLWSGNKNGRENGGPEKVVAVWRYVVDKFREAGADNVKWIWNPHGPSIDVSEEAWNELAKYYPGDDYVDWFGMDAYNWYPKDPWGGARPYRDFDNCFRNLYDACLAINPDKPVMIAEFATPEFEYEGATKADWIKDAFTKMKTEYPQIKLFVWFHINKELDWRVNSSPEALKAFNDAVADPYFVGVVKSK